VSRLRSDGGLHLTSHPPLAAYLLLAVPALALIWRDHRPVGVLGLAVAELVGWAALGQIDGVALVPVMVATTMRYDRARHNLDRHPNYILAAYMASGT